MRDAGHGLRGAGWEMLSLILELQTCQLGFCFAHVVTIHWYKMSFSRFVALYVSIPRHAPADHALQPF